MGHSALDSMRYLKESRISHLDAPIAVVDLILFRFGPRLFIFMTLVLLRGLRLVSSCRRSPPSLCRWPDAAMPHYMIFSAHTSQHAGVCRAGLASGRPRDMFSYLYLNREIPQARFHSYRATNERLQMLQDCFEKLGVSSPCSARAALGQPIARERLSSDSSNEHHFFLNQLFENAVAESLNLSHSPIDILRSLMPTRPVCQSSSWL